MKSIILAIFYPVYLWSQNTINPFVGFIVFELSFIIPLFLIFYLLHRKNLANSWRELSKKKRRDVLALFFGGSFVIFILWYVTTQDSSNRPTPAWISNFGEWFVSFLESTKILK